VRMHTRRDWVIASAIAVSGVLLLLGIVAFALWLATPSQPGNRSFDRALWLRHDEPFDPVRGQMSLDLIRRYLKPGISRKQVRRLLGPPDPLGSPRSYTIGAARGFPGGEIDLVFRHRRLVRATRFVCCALGG
jgi:hypothetical protein